MSSALKLVQLYFPKVQHIKDAKEGITIEVTDGDRFRAKKQDHKECALAVACKREYHLDGAIVSINRAYLVKGNEATRYDVRAAISREIVALDRGGDFASGHYTLHAIPKQSRLGVKRKNVPSGAKPGKKKRPTPHVTKGVRHILQ